MLDWAYYNGDNLSGQVMMWCTQEQFDANTDWFHYLSLQTSLTYGGFNNWKLPNFNEVVPILLRSSAGSLSYEPFNNASAVFYWLNETDVNSPGMAWTFSSSVTFRATSVIKTATQNVRRAYYNRLATYSVTGGNVVIT
jgi:hypothetical protein